MTTVQINLPDELTHTLGYSKLTARVEGFGSSIAALVWLFRELVNVEVFHDPGRCPASWNLAK